MLYALIKHPEDTKLKPNGIPSVSSETDETTEVFHPKFDFTDLDKWNYFFADFVDPVDDLCDSLLDYGDIDYFNTESCEKLVPWLEDRLTRPCPDWAHMLYEKLLEYAREAVRLGTGVVVEL